ncbi:Hypothetical protein PFR_JS7-2_1904 [Propionibacterium freudenreichii]|nr:Hypothetical protein PFR_JS7-1_1962 [Propionibacterium freudenreichii]SCQ54422.1 Hypothetical protein PFR_JS7-2_1904 [Propionibacterium freudenreichii]
MRGERAPSGCFPVGPRITPAYAGRTPQSRPVVFAGSDHPRVCGENGFSWLESFRPDGSPPRMRGEPGHDASELVDVGITPAYAGRTIQKLLPIFADTDHPRVCGENHRAASRWGPSCGSPPRMRGEPRRPGSRPAPPRITPAYAGRTPDVMVPATPAGDHPRVCGENHPVRNRNAVQQGITPAYAGRTDSSARIRAQIEDHPRVCGENTSHQSVSEVGTGSPPRMRGEPRRRSSRLSSAGITPAYAGRTRRPVAVPRS